MIAKITIINNKKDINEMVRVVRGSIEYVTYSYELLDVSENENEIEMSFDIIDRDLTIERIRFELATMIDSLGLDCSFVAEKEEDEYEDDDIDVSALLFP